MNLGAWGPENLNWHFLSGILNIIFINLILSGDNAVIIAMAVRPLTRRQRLVGIALGSGAAIVLRIGLTFFIAQILYIKFIKLIGGILIFWIAIKLFLNEGVVQDTGSASTSIWQALWVILVADVTMSLDNVLAVAGASQGNFFLLVFGLTLSIPIVVFSSGLLSMLMDRYPLILYFGAAILGRVSAEMIFSDPLVEGWLSLTIHVKYAMEAVFALAVIGIGKLWLWYTFNRALQHLPQKGGANFSSQSKEE
jgi:YjbE family integral membrane protein